MAESEEDMDRRIVRQEQLREKDVNVLIAAIDAINPWNKESNNNDENIMVVNGKKYDKRYYKGV